MNIYNQEKFQLNNVKIIVRMRGINGIKSAEIDKTFQTESTQNKSPSRVRLYSSKPNSSSTTNLQNKSLTSLNNTKSRSKSPVTSK